MKNDLLTRRILMCVCGVSLCGICVGMFSCSDLGLDPFQVFAHGLWNLTGMSFGLFYALLNAVLLVIVFFTDRRKIGLGTLINLFLLGYIAEYSQKFWESLLPGAGLPARMILLGCALVLMCLSSALYFTADLGVSTYDAQALMISERQQKIHFRYVRILTDLFCVVIGGIFGGRIGIATLITAFFMGPLISFFRIKAAEPLLHR